MRALASWIVFLMACGPSTEARPAARDPSERWPGGETSVEEIGARAFSLPARNLDVERRAAFSVGNNLFADNWVTAPSSTSARDGLGPRFDALSCSGCHLHDGRGRIEEDGSIESAVVRLSVDGMPHPIYGGQLQRRALLGLVAEGSARVVFTPNARGLSAPLVRLTFARGEVVDVATSLRVAPQIIGLGLLEAVSPQAILAHADPDDADGDGISGRPNRVLDLRTGELVLGRFGWKANQPSVEQQVASALAGDLGITSSLVPESECAPDDLSCSTAPSGGTPEISDELLAFLVLYSRTLAVPAARAFDDPEVLRGRSLFASIGCDRCHVPSFTTGESDVPALAHQRIYPYTDLLLHDMGEELADHRADFAATGTEWRTPPLWGIGLIEGVNAHQQLLHDGRAGGVDEAIRWHGGEAERARRAYEALTEGDRSAVVSFVNAI